MLGEEFRRTPISLTFEAELWIARGKAVPIGVIEFEYAQGMIAYAAKQADLFLDLAACTTAAQSEPRIARGKKRPRAPISDALAKAMMRDAGEDSDGDDDDGDDDDDVDGEQSDEELVMGGEVDEE
jgi:hypothetical protein